MSSKVSYRPEGYPNLTPYLIVNDGAAAIEFYAEAFEDAGALDKLEAFASHFGADFYQLPRNTDKITLVKNNWQAPEFLHFADTHLIPLRAGETLRWQLQSA